MDGDSAQEVNEGRDVQEVNTGPLMSVGDGAKALDHGPDGKFLPGNRAAIGNPFARRVNEIRSLLMEVSDDDLRAVIATLVKTAQRSQSPVASTIAAREILDRLLGKAVQSIAVAADVRDGNPPVILLDFGKEADDDSAKPG